MRTMSPVLHINAGSVKRILNSMGDRTAVNSCNRRSACQKHKGFIGNWPGIFQVVNDRLTDIGKEWQLKQPARFVLIKRDQALFP